MSQIKVYSILPLVLIGLSSMGHAQVRCDESLFGTQIKSNWQDLDLSLAEKKLAEFRLKTEKLPPGTSVRNHWEQDLTQREAQIALVKRLIGDPSEVSRAALSPDRRFLVVRLNRGVEKKYDLDAQTETVKSSETENRARDFETENRLSEAKPVESRDSLFENWKTLSLENTALGRERSTLLGMNGKLLIRTGRNGVEIRNSENPESGPVFRSNLAAELPTLSGNGEYLFFNLRNENSIVAIDLKTMSTARFKVPAYSYLVAVSKDGAQVAISTPPGQIAILQPQTGALTKVYASPKRQQIDNVKFARNDKTLVFLDGTELISLDDKTGQARTLTTEEVHDFSILTDEKDVVYRKGWDFPKILNIETLKQRKLPTELAADPEKYIIFTASADGKAFIFHSGQEIQIRSTQPGAPLLMRIEIAYLDAKLNPQGTRLVVLDQKRNVRMFDLIQKTEILVPANIRNIVDVNFSADGKKLFAVGLNGEIYVGF